MKALILGSKGMAGHVVYSYLKENTDWEIIALGRSEFEIDETGLWKEKILKLSKPKKIDYVINCIGMLRLESTANPILAIRVNSLFPHELAKLCSSIDSKVIHLSTDCWKDIDVYGRSKRAGELDYENHLTLRTSIIGPELKKEGQGLFHWFMMQKNEVDGFINHYWDGVTTLELAKNLKEIIEEKPSLNHIKEFRSEKRVSKYELLNYVKDVFVKKIKINKKQTEVIDKSCSTPDIIAKISLLDQIKELKKWMLDHGSSYAQYGIK